MSNKRPRYFDAVVMQYHPDQLDAGFAENESSIKKEEFLHDSDEFKPPLMWVMPSSASVQSYEDPGYKDQSTLESPLKACSHSSSIEEVILNVTSGASIDEGKEDFDDTYRNISDLGSFEMVGDVSDLRVNFESLLDVSKEHSSDAHQCQKMKVETGGTDNNCEKVQDPFYIDVSLKTDNNDDIMGQEQDPLYIDGKSEAIANEDVLAEPELQDPDNSDRRQLRKRVEKVVSTETRCLKPKKKNQKKGKERRSNVKSCKHGKSKGNCKLSDGEIKKLRSLKVFLKHEVPPQHTIEKAAGTHSPSKDEHQAMKRHTCMIKGAFSSQEDQQLNDNWRLFCKVHNWDVKKVQPFIEMRPNRQFYIRSLEQRKNFVRFLAKGLPRRTLHSVYSRFKILYNTELRKGPYTEDEDQAIVSMLQKRSQRSVNKAIGDVAKLLKRTRRSVIDRYRKLTPAPLFSEPETN